MKDFVNKARPLIAIIRQTSLTSLAVRELGFAVIRFIHPALEPDWNIEKDEHLNHEPGFTRPRYVYFHPSNIEFMKNNNMIDRRMSLAYGACNLVFRFSLPLSMMVFTSTYPCLGRNVPVPYGNVPLIATYRRSDTSIVCHFEMCRNLYASQTLFPSAPSIPHIIPNFATCINAVVSFKDGACPSGKLQTAQRIGSKSVSVTTLRQ